MLNRKALQKWTIAFLIATATGAATFHFAQPVIQRFYRDPKYAAQLKIIKGIEKEMTVNKKFDNLPFWFESDDRKKLEDALSNLKRGREKAAGKLFEEVYADFNRRVNKNLELKQRIRELRKTDSFRQQIKLEKSRRKSARWAGGITAATLFTGVNLFRRRKQKKGIPQRPRSGKRGA